MDTVVSGHNSHELTPKERKAVLMRHMKTIAAQVAICNQANEERKRLRKLAKADGIAMADLNYGLRLLQIENPDIIIDEQRRHQELADWFGVPVFTQAEFNFEREPAIDRARREGAAAGAIGKDDDSPYPEGTAQAAAWHEGWKQEQADMLAAWASAMEKRAAGQADEDDEAA